MQPDSGDRSGDRKMALRHAALAARRQLGADDRAVASSAVVTRLLALPELRHTRVVVLYAASADEVDLAGAVEPLTTRGARTCFPRVDGDRLLIVAVTDPRTLQVGFRGIREPNGPSLHPSAVDAVVLPGVAFDPHGNRLGQGGGHYDRLLADLPRDAVRVGVCFACQVVPDVPREPHDAPVDVVVSDRAVYRSTRRSGTSGPEDEGPVSSV